MGSPEEAAVSEDNVDLQILKEEEDEGEDKIVNNDESKGNKLT